MEKLKLVGRCMGVMLSANHLCYMRQVVDDATGLCRAIVMLVTLVTLLAMTLVLADLLQEIIRSAYLIEPAVRRALKVITIIAQIK